MNDFVRLTTQLTNPRISTADKFEQVCKLTSQLITGASRVSLWRFSPDFERIESLILYDKASGRFSSGQTLTKQQFSPYFNAILNQEVVNAADARNHKAAQCFTDDYFKPNNIYSLLDFVLHKDFSPTGIICCESVGKIVQWTQEDVENMGRIARASSMYIK